MRLAAIFVLAIATAAAAETLDVFGHRWTVRFASDWKVDQEGGVPVLRLIQGREPDPGPRRPMQYALADLQYSGPARVEVDVKPLKRSLMIVFAWRDAAHFDYAHLSTDTAAQQPVHNGVFHVYGGERVRISNERGPAAFPALDRWYHVVLRHDPGTGTVDVSVDGKPVPALRAVDLSLGGGRIGLGSFDETGDFRNFKVQQ